jgi:hypothetical protein
MVFNVDPDGNKVPMEIEDMRNEISSLGPINIGKCAMAS